MAAEAFVVGALLNLDAGSNPAAVGAAVTTALCGHYEHEGPCRWPHNNAIDSSGAPARFRTLYVADPAEAELVESRVRAALEASSGWATVVVERRPVGEADGPLAARLLRGPRAPG